MLDMSSSNLVRLSLAYLLLCTGTTGVLAATRIVLHDSTGSLVTARIDPVVSSGIVSSQ